MALPNDDSIYPVILELAGCLQAEYEDADEKLDEVQLITGQDIAVDGLGEDCNSAVGYVRFSLAFPSEGNFPAPEPSTSPCGTVFGYQITVGVVRCAPEMQDDGSPPPKIELNEFLRLQLADMAAMRRAISCCLADKFDDRLHSIIQYAPLPAQGGIGGGEWQLVVQEG